MNLGIDDLHRIFSSHGLAKMDRSRLAMLELVWLPGSRVDREHGTLFSPLLETFMPATSTPPELRYDQNYPMQVI
jgi:hypothetical protein